MGKITTEEWIKRAREIHGDKYDYSKSEYINARTNITMICHEKDEHGVKHGEFSITPNHHLQGQGCPKCKRGFSVKKTENFIEKSKLIHGDKFDYSEVKYIKNNLKVRIICHEKDKLGEEHGEFLMRPNDHLMGVGCPKCGNKRRSELKKYSLNEFIEKAKKIHGDKYDYSKVEYKGSLIEVCIICPIHGEFWQQPVTHLRGNGCYKCGELKRIKSKMDTREEFIWKAIQKHGYKYDYRKVNYIHNRTPVCIVCPIHGEFWQTPSEHLKGCGCSICGGTKKSTTEEFIEKARKVHGDKYDYSKVNYVNNRTKVIIICHEKDKNGNEHGEFWQTPHAHLALQGCPICKESKLETEMRLFLNKNNISFEREKNFSWLGRLSLDFYLPDYKIGIECQGIQHFGIGGWSKPKVLEGVVERDKRKLSLCNENGIKLLYYSNLGIEYPYQVYEDLDKLLIKIKQND